MNFLGRATVRRAALAGLATMVLVSCAGTVPMTMSLGVNPPDSWKPTLSAAQVATVRMEFPSFVPEYFAPGTNATARTSLNSTNFTPAQFFGPPNPQGFKPTPGGIMVETNGYDQSVPAALPATGTYFSPSGTQLTFTLGSITEYPLNSVEGKVNPTQLHSPNGAPLTIDLSTTQVDPAYIDSLTLDLQSRFATVFPAVANVDPTSCKIVIEPSVLFDQIGSNPPAITDGYTSGTGGNPGPITIHVAVFYITADGTVYNWADALIAQAAQFYLWAAKILPPPTPQFLVRNRQRPSSEFALSFSPRLWNSQGATLAPFSPF